MADRLAAIARGEQVEEVKDEVMTLTVKDESNKKAWDGEPLQTKEEIERQKELFAWLIEDMKNFDAQQTEEEKRRREEFEDEQAKPSEEGGDSPRRRFDEELDKCFNDAN